MAPMFPELARDDVRGVFDGELVAFQDAVPHFPLVGARLLHRKREVPVAYAVFDVLELDGEATTNLPYAERQGLLESLELVGGFWFVPPVFDDGPALFSSVCEQGLEGVVAKRPGLPLPARRSRRLGEGEEPRLLAVRPGAGARRSPPHEGHLASAQSVPKRP